MTWKMHDKEFQTVLSLPPPQQYAYFVKRVADWGEVWSLFCQRGWVLAGDDEGNELVPVWPHERFAAACVTGAWSDALPRAIKLADWLERWTPGMIRDGRKVAVFPRPNGKGMPVAPERLKEDIESERARFVG